MWAHRGGQDIQPALAFLPPGDGVARVALGHGRYSPLPAPRPPGSGPASVGPMQTRFLRLGTALASSGASEAPRP